jgi:hypothetical protein
MHFFLYYHEKIEITNKNWWGVVHESLCTMSFSVISKNFTTRSPPLQLLPVIVGILKSETGERSRTSSSA